MALAAGCPPPDRQGVRTVRCLGTFPLTRPSTISSLPPLLALAIRVRGTGTMAHQGILWLTRDRHHATQPPRPQCEERRRALDVQTEEHVALEIASREGNHGLAKVMLDLRSVAEQALNEELAYGLMLEPHDVSRNGEGELARVLPEVASQIARDHGQAMTRNGARKLAKCRSGLVRMAMATGALRSKQSGRRWITTAGEVADWIKRGRPSIVAQAPQNGSGERQKGRAAAIEASFAALYAANFLRCGDRAVYSPQGQR